MDLVSIIIPSYKQPRFLRTAIDSARDQDYANIEVVVVDDESRDRSLSVALDSAALDPRVRVVARLENGGLGAARNLGLDVARGKYVLFLDSDDFLLPGAVTALMRTLHDADGDVVGSYGDWVHVPEHVDRLRHQPEGRDGKPVLSSSNYRGVNLFICSAPLVLRSAVVDVGGFSELPMLEDFVTWVRIIDRGGAFLPAAHVVTAYRQRSGSMLRSGGSSMPGIAAAINRWWLEQGHDLAGDGRLRAFLDGDDPTSSGRRAWSVVSRIDDGPTRNVVPERRSAGDERVALLSSELAACCEHGLQRTTDKVVESASIAKVYERNEGLMSMHTPPPDPDSSVVLVPSCLESAQEVVAVRRALVKHGIPAVIGISQRTDQAAIWPMTLASEPTLLMQDIDQPHAPTIVLGAEREAARWAKRFGKQQVIHRTAGIEPLRTGVLGAARRFRTTGLLGLRSRLEMAELGDRPAFLLPSGVPFVLDEMFGPASPRDDVIVYVPDALVDWPALDGWVVSALDAASGRAVRLMGSTRAAQRLEYLGVAELDIGACRGASRVVLPICDEITLFQAIGVEPVLFIPNLVVDEWSLGWRRSLCVAASQVELVRALDDPLQRDPALRQIASIVDPDVDEAAWELALVEFIGPWLDGLTNH